MDSMKLEKRLIVAEDVNFDSTGNGEEVAIPNGSGGTIIAHKINAGHVPLKSETAQEVGTQDVDTALSILNNKLGAIEMAGEMAGDTVIEFDAADGEPEIQAKIDECLRNLGGHTLTFSFPPLLDRSLLASINWERFYNGALVIEGNGIAVSDAVALPYLFGIRDCACHVTVRNFNFTHNHGDTKYAIAADNCVGVEVKNCGFTGINRQTYALKLRLANGFFDTCAFNREKRVFVEGLLGAGGGNGGGKALFEIFPALVAEAPVGAVPLDGRTLYYCNSVDSEYFDFFQKAIEYKSAFKIPVKTAAEYEAELNATGQCGSFVVDEVTGSIRLPKLKSFIQNVADYSPTNSGGTIGTVHRAGVPNISGQFPNGDGDVLIEGLSSLLYSAEASAYMGLHSGAFHLSGGTQHSDYLSGGNFSYVTNTSADRWGKVTFDASRCDSAYGAAETVQPESFEVCYYIQVAEGDTGGAGAIISGGIINGDLDVKGLLTAHSGIVLSNGGITAATGGAWIARRYLDSAGSSGSAYMAVSSAAARLGVHVNGSNADASLLATVDGGVVLNHSGSGFTGRLYLSSGGLTFSGASGGQTRSGTVALLNDIPIFSGGEVISSTWFQSSVTVSGALFGSGGLVATASNGNYSLYYARVEASSDGEENGTPRVAQFVEHSGATVHDLVGFTAGVFDGARVAYSTFQYAEDILVSFGGITLKADYTGDTTPPGAFAHGARIDLHTDDIAMSCSSLDADRFYIYNQMSMGSGGIELRQSFANPASGAPSERLLLSGGHIIFSGASGGHVREGEVALLSDITSGGAVFSGGEVAQSTWFQSNVTVSGALHGSGGFMATALYSGSANWYARAGVHPHMENNVYPQVEQFVEWINPDYRWAGFTAGVYNGARLSYSHPQMDATVLAGFNGVTLSAGNEGAMPTGASVEILDGGITMSCMSVNADDFYVYGKLTMSEGGVELRHYVDDPEPGSPRERLLLSGGNLVFSGSSGNRERQGVVALLGDIASGAIVSNAAFTTSVGPYTVTLTSGGGLAVSGSGASVVLSGGQIAASAGEDGGRLIVTSGGVEMRGALGDVDEPPYISVGRDSIAGDNGNGVGFNMGGYQFNVDAEGFNYNGHPVAAALVTSTNYNLDDPLEPTASIGVLDGGVNYVYTVPLYQVNVSSVTKTTDASYIHFTLDSVTAVNPVVISGVSYLNSATFEGGKEYLVGFFDGMAVVNEVTQ